MASSDSSGPNLLGRRDRRTPVPWSHSCWVSCWACGSADAQILSSSCTSALTVDLNLAFVFYLLLPLLPHLQQLWVGSKAVLWWYAAVLGHRGKEKHHRGWILDLPTLQGCNCCCWAVTAIPARCWGHSIWLQPLEKLRDYSVWKTPSAPWSCPGGQRTVCSPLLWLHPSSCV